jgi:hypothetical protein
MKPLSLATAIAVAAALATPVVAEATATLSGPSSLKVQQKLEYRATGLTPEGSYSLRIRRVVQHDGRSYRCAAFLSAPRKASGTERFFGSLPTGLQCVPARGTGATWQPHTSKGVYEAVACVAAARNLCSGHFAVAGRTVRVG